MTRLRVLWPPPLWFLIGLGFLALPWFLAYFYRVLSLAGVVPCAMPLQ
jgi:hypothetical protein